MLISIVIPVYCTTNSLPEIARRVEAVFEARDEDYELIFVDDCSPNADTWPTLEEVARQHDRVEIIQLTRNFGQQNATLAGCARSRGELVMIMDDDLQHDPADIPKFLDASDHDIIIGQFRHKKHNAFKRITSWIKGWFDYLIIGRPKGLQSSSFRMISRTVVDGMLSFRTPNPFLPALLFHISKDIVGVDVGHDERAEGKSGYNLRKMIALFSNLIINNSSFLLRIVAYFGMITALGSLVMFVWVIYRKLAMGISVTGWASLMAAMLLIGGVQLLAMGLIGEYLLRTIQSSEGKPPYVIRRTGPRAITKS